MFKLDVGHTFSPLMYGTCEFDKEVKKWLDKNTPNFELKCEASYAGTLHLDSGSDPYKKFTIIFENASDALFFKTTFGVGNV